MYLIGTFQDSKGGSHTLFFDYGGRISEKKRTKIARKFLAYGKKNNIVKETGTVDEALELVKNSFYFGKYSDVSISDNRYETANGSFHIDNMKQFKV